MLVVSVTTSARFDTDTPYFKEYVSTSFKSKSLDAVQIKVGRRPVSSSCSGDSKENSAGALF